MAGIEPKSEQKNTKNITPKPVFMRKVLLRTLCSLTIVAVLLSALSTNAKPAFFSINDAALHNKAGKDGTFKKPLGEVYHVKKKSKSAETPGTPLFFTQETRTYNFDNGQLVRNLSIPANAYDIKIYARGASGGSYFGNDGGRGAFFNGDYNTSLAGSGLTILVGQKGSLGSSGSGGGGGSFVFLNGTNESGFPLIAAGGGGGAGSLAIDPATEALYPDAVIDANLGVDGYYGLSVEGVLTGGDPGSGGGAGGNSPDYTTGETTASNPGAGGGAGWIPADHSSDANGFILPSLNGIYHGNSPNDVGGAVGGNSGNSGAGGYGGGGANNAYGGGGGGGYSGGGGGTFDGNADGTHGGGGGSYFNSGAGTQTNSGHGSPDTDGQIIVEWKEPTACTPPVITGTTNLTQSTALNLCTAVVNYPAVTATGTSPAVTYSFSGATTVATTSGTGSGQTFNKGVTTVLITATNACGTVTASFTVTVNDTQNPTITAPAAITVNVDANSCAATNVSLGNAIFSDNCPGVTVSNNAPTSFPKGNTTVTWTATDAVGLTATATQIVTVVDNIPPSVTCPANISVSATSVAGAVVTYSAPVGTDNCPGATTTLTAGLPSGSTFPIGTTTVTYTVTDAAGQSVSCSFTVTVTCVPPVATITASGSTAFCVGGSVTLTASAGSSYLWSNGATTQAITTSVAGSYTVTVSNAAGCSATSAATTVTVNPLPTPTITPSGPTTFCAGGSVVLTASPGILYAWSTGQNTQSITVNFSAPNIRVNVTDANGCSANSAATRVTVNPNVTPTFTQVAAICSGASLAALPTTSSNNITGTWSPALNNTATTTYTFTPDAGQCATTATMTITVNPLPTATISASGPTTFCPGGSVTLTASAGSSYSWSNGATTQSITVSAAGSYTVTVSNGACSATSAATVVTVQDVTPPATPVLPTITAECSATVPVATTTDNCAGTINGTTPDPLTYNTQGSYIIHWTFNDGNGNTTTANQQVIILDVTPPSISCPANMSVSATSGAGAVVTYSAPVGTDNCPGAVTTLTAGLPSGSTFPIGTTTVTYTVTDAAGQSVSCSFTVTVTCVATTPTITAGGPTTFCPGGSVTLTASAGASYAWSNGATTQSITVSAAGSYTVSVSNGACSATSAATVVTVQDVTPPATPVLPTITAECSATVPVATTTDNCAGTINGTTPDPLTYNTQGSYIIHWTFNDGNGNTTTANQQVIILDVTPPSISCPSNISVSATSGAGAVVTYSAPVGTDNCPGAVTTLTAGLPSGSTFPIGTTTVTYTVTDAAGQSVSCSFTVTVTCVATTPTITAGGPTTFCPGGSVTLTASAGSSYSWSNGATTQSITVSAAGSYTVSVSNGACSATSAATVVTVQDVTPPATPVLPTITAECSATVPVATTTDNCAGTINGTTPDPLTYNTQGSYIIHWTFNDGNGNTTTANQQVIILDVTPPSISCPSNISVSATSGAGAVVTYSAPVGTDNCPGAVTTLTAGLPSGSTFPIGTTTVTYTVTDAAGQSVSCSFTVTVTCVATTPTITAGGPTTFCPGGSVTLTASAGSSYSWSNGATTQSITVSAAGSYTVTVSNGACSATSAATVVTVQDVTPPSITCPANLLRSNDYAQCSRVITWAMPTATDNCGGVTVTQIAGLPSGSAYPVGVSTITLRATDASGNSTTCSFTITVVDNQGPFVSGIPPATLTVQCNAVPAPATLVANDNCDSNPTITFTEVRTNGNCPGNYTLTRTWIVRDNAGNGSNHQQIITVVDNTAPVISCPSTITVSNTTGQCGANVSFAVTATDNCGSANVTYSIAPGSFFAVGTTTVTATATDDCGNTSSCSFIVRVVDTENPVIVNLPANISKSNDAGQCGAIVTWSPVSVTDNCPGAVLSATHASGAQYPVGTTVVVYTATDASGNTVNGSFTVTVTDTQKPTVVCPSSISVIANTTESSVSGANVTYGTATASDNCGVASVTYSKASGSFFPVGTTTVTVTVVDVNGNEETCSFDVTVTCVTPVITVCGTNQTVPTTTGRCDAPATYTVTASGVPAANYSYTFSGATTGSGSGTGSGSIFNKGVTTVVVTASNICGTTSCSFTVTVVDTENPVIVNLPANISKSNDAGQCGAIVTWSPVSVTDNCPGAVLSATHASGAQYPVGTTVVVYTATDASGNSVNGSFTVTVTDTQKPTVVCPSNVSVIANTTESSVSGANVTYGTATASDNCGVASVTYSKASGTFFPVGTTTVTVTVVDVNGNEETCSFDVTVTCVTPVITVCGTNQTVPTTTGRCDAPATYTVTASGVPAANYSYTFSGATTGSGSGTGSGSIFNKGVTTVVVTASNICGTTSCSFTVTVVDTENPVIVNLPANISKSNDAGQCGAIVTWSPVSVTDNCPGAVLSATHASGAQYPVGTTVVVYTATDASGNSVNGSFTVTVTDTQKPTVVCPSNVSVIANTTESSVSGANVTYGTATASDNCGVASVTYSKASGTFFPVGTTTVTVTVVDVNGNEETCSFDVTVTCVTPVITVCGTNQTVPTTTGRCDAPATYTVTASGVPAANYSYTFSGATTGSGSGTGSGSIFNKGVTTVVVTASNICGTTSCSFTVTVVDTENPVIVNLPANISKSNDAGQCGAIVTWSPVSVTDNCPGAVLSATHASGAQYPVGTTVVVYTATDASGNSVNGSFTVTVTDTQKPTVVCPSNVSVIANTTESSVSGANVTYGTATASDNCGVASVTYSKASGTFFPVGTTTVTVTVVDVNGNEETCSFDVTVTCVTPVITVCGTNQTVPTTTGRCDAPATYTVTASGVPAANYSYTFSGATTGSGSGTGSGSIFNKGVTTVVVTASNICGTTSCSFTVTVVDTENPVIVNLPANISKSNDAGQCGAIVTWSPVSVTDNCPGAVLSATHASGAQYPVGTTVVVYTATDASGNSVNGSFTVTVTDTQKPTVVCPSNVSVIANTTESSVSGANVTYGTATASDNCGVASVTYSKASGTFFPVGTTTVTVTVVDVNGNEETCSFDVTVTCVTPVITVCGTNQTVPTTTGRCDAPATYTVTASGVPAANYSYTFSGATTGSGSGTGSGSIFNKGVTTVVVTASNICGTTSCSFTVTVVDTENPVIVNLPANISKSNDAGQCGAIVTWSPVSVTDNCPGAVLSATHASGAQYPVGTTVVVYTATDASGNSVNGSFTVTVTDTQKPTVVCPSNVSVIANTTESSVSGANVTYGTATASDNCGVASVTYSKASGTFFPVGTTTVTVTVVDVNGNEETCSFDVTVTCVTPVITVCGTNQTVPTTTGRCDAPATYTVTASGVPAANYSYTFSGATTGSGSGTGSGSIFNKGVTTVVVTASNICGTTSCSFTVTVVDTENPVIVNLPANISKSNDAGQCGAIVTWSPVSVTDNCPGAVLSATHASGAQYPVGTTVVVYTATDASGNSVNGSFTVTVTDEEDPIITIPADVTHTADPGVCSFTFGSGNNNNNQTPNGNGPNGNGGPSNITLGTATASDNCAAVVVTGLRSDGQPLSAAYPVGVTTIQWTATDAHGRTSGGVQTVTVTDDEFPTIVAPIAVTVSADAGSCATLASNVTLGTPVTGDNCGTTPPTNNAPVSFPIGTTTVTWSVTDIHGHTSTATQTVTVVDNQNPTFTCPANITIAGTPGLNGANVTSFTVTDAADNCGTPIITYSIQPGSFFAVGTTTPVTITVTDANGNAVSCTITVTVINNPPVAQPDVKTTQEDVSVSGNVLTNDSDVDGNAITVTGFTVNSINYSAGATATLTEGTLVINADGSFTFTPAPNYNGSVPVATYYIVDTHGATANSTLTIDVTPVDDVPVANNDTETVNEDGVLTATVTGNDILSGDGGNVWSVVSSTTHGTLVFNTNGTYTYTPNANFNGTDVFTYQLCDADGDCSTATVTITVVSVDDLPIATNDTETVNEDGVLTATVTGNDILSGDGGNVWSVVSTTTHGTLVFNTNGTYTYTPNANFNGTDVFTYQLCDADGDCSTATVTITVVSVDDLPIATNDTETVNEDGVLTATVTGNDILSGDGGNVWSVVSTTTNGTLVFNTNGTYTYTPNANFNGTDVFTYQLCDADGDCSTATVTITVVSVDDLPIATNDTETVNEDGVLTATVTGNDILSGDGGNVWSVVSTTTHGTLVFNTNGTYTYTPNANFNGTDVFTYQLCDADGDCSTATVTITVVSVDDLPIATNDTETVNEDGVLTATVTGNDILSGDGGNVWSVVSTTTNGTLVFNTNGTYTYTPNANFNGTDVFTYQLCDADGDCSTATVTITVVSVDDAPVATNDTETVNEDGVLTATVTGNDILSGDGGNVWSVVSTTTNGTLVFNTNGTYTYTPNANFNGTDVFTYQLCDADGDCSTATVTITVVSVDDAPVATNDTETVNEDGVLTATVTGNDILSGDGGNVWSVVSTTTNGTLVFNTNGTYTYTPNANFNGTDVFTYQLCDADGDCSTATVTITVVSVDDLPVATNDSETVNEDGVLTATVTGNDILSGDGGNVWSVVSTTTNGTLVFNTNGTYTYTPNANFNGTDVFTYQLCDADGDCSTATVTITVVSVNDVPVAVNDVVSTTEDTPVSGTVTGNDTPSGDGGNVWSVVTTTTHGTLVFNTNGTYTYTPNANFNGTDVFTYKVCDANGDCSTATVTITVTLVDDPAVIKTKDITVYVDQNGQVTITAGDIDDGSYDPDGIASITIDKTSFDCSKLGPNTVTMTVTDVNGNSASATAIVTVRDIIAPVITCPAPVTVQCASAVPAPNTALVTASDNCSAVISHVGDVISNQTATNKYTITRTYRAVDPSGNSAECTQIITVNDNVAPVLTISGSLPGNANGQCIGNVPAAPATASIAALYSDNCSGPITAVLTNTLSTGTNGGGWTVKYFYTVTDASGNETIAAVIYTGRDTQSPVPTVATLPTVTGQCAATVTAPTATDNCAGLITATTSNPTSYTAQGTYTITWNFSDGNGNTSSQTQTVIVKDVTKPVVNCPSSITTTSTTVVSGTSGAYVNFTATATDNCSTPVVTYSHAPGSFFPVGSTTVTVTATDAAGNVSTCSFTVTVGCVSPVVTVSSTPTNNTYTGGPSTNLYLGYGAQSTTLKATPATAGTYTYQWSGTASSMLSSTTTQSPVFTPTQGGNYTFAVEVTTAAGCKTTSYITICVTDIRVFTSATTNNCNHQSHGSSSCSHQGHGHSCSHQSHGSSSCPDNNSNNGHNSCSHQSHSSSNCSHQGHNHSCNHQSHSSSSCSDRDDDDDDNDHQTMCNHQSHSSYDCSHKGHNHSCSHRSHSSYSCSHRDTHSSDNDDDDDDDDKNCDHRSHSSSDCSHRGHNHNSCNHQSHSSSNCGHKKNYGSSEQKVCNHQAHSSNDCNHGGHNHNSCNHRSHSSSDCVHNNNGGNGGCNDDDEDNSKKVYICHVPPGNAGNPLTLSISVNAVAAHLANHPGDRLGSCSQQPCTGYTDTEKPVIDCPDNKTVTYGSSIAPSLTGSPEADDNSGDVTITYTDASNKGTNAAAANFYNYVITRTWKATDLAGNFSTCAQIITVQETVKPVITCPASATVACGSTAPTVTGNATATDNASAVTITYTDVVSGNKTTRTWKATDASGNYATCTQTITVVDNVKPVISDVADITINCGASSAPSATGTATATDNCSTANVTYSDVPGTNKITRTWKATDAAGNYITSTQVITIVDLVKPTITVPANITVNCGASTAPSSCGGSATGTDNCSSVTVSYTDVTNGNVISRTWKTTDASGNSSTGVQTITIIDNVKPVISDPSDISVSCGSSTTPSGCGSVATATDNCSTPVVTYTDVTVGNKITRTWKATDAAGNFSTSTQIITIVDNTKPVLTEPNDITVSCGSATSPSVTGNATATDNCSAVTITYRDEPYNATTIKRYWKATDASGNFSEAYQKITVSDNVKPVITDPADVSVNCGSSTLPSATGTATATDNCSSATVTYSDATSGNVITRTWKATDAAGNFSTGTQTITIVDNVKPVLSVPGNITVSCGASTTPSGCNSTATATDNCSSATVTYSDATSGNVITRTWKATDASGNFSTGTQTITVIDNVKPVLSVPGNITVSCGSSTTPSGCNSSATATDNCSTPVVTYTDVTSGNVITRTWKATDAAGNFSTGNQTVTIVDNVKPVITDPADNVVNCGSSTLPSATGTATATDNCSTPVVTYTDVTSGNVITRTWKATDAAGNFSTATQLITRGAAFTTAITSVPTNSTYTGGIATNLYLGYGAQSTALQIGSLPSSGAPYTYVWSGSSVNRLNSTTSAAPVFTPSTFGSYSFSVLVTNKFGCTSTASISICVTDIRVPGCGGTKVYVCQTTTGRYGRTKTLEVAISQVSSYISSANCNDNEQNRLGSCSQTPCNTTSVNSVVTTNTFTVTKEGEPEVATTEEELKVTVMPNPSTTFFTLKLESKYETPVSLRVMDGNGRVVDAKTKIGSNSTFQIGHNYSSGTYYAELIQGTKRKVVQLIKARG